jgi:hypothetical protein
MDDNKDQSGAAVRGEAVVLTDDQIANFWMNRDCMDAIRAGDVVAQFVSAFRAGMKAIGVSPRAADALDSQPTDRVKELESQLAECVARSQKWAHAAGLADGRAEKLRAALEYYADPKTNAPGSVAREALADASRQPTDGGVRK